ncbi:MAG: Membrane protein involved in colicin uptake [Candidatus Saccharibacteria bacterium]|nr:Membrane protein involved in colicin uptake [Candidatus Saccharibacteria bacterium]
MAQVVREVRERSIRDDDLADDPPPSARSEYTMTVAERIIYYIGGVIMAVIALRILLSLMGANRGNAFASFIYNVSYPFVAPFFGLFNYRMQYGVSRFEFESVVALIVWGLITAGVARLVTLGSRRGTV